MKLRSRVIDFIYIDEKHNAAGLLLTGCHKLRNGGYRTFCSALTRL